MSAPVILSAAATKGGVGKTTLIANVSGVLADIGPNDRLRRSAITV